ncbi:MAG: Uma2 family endonuclease [Thermosynechococcaceae cyanobacterium]
MVQALPKSIALEAFLQQPETEPASEYIDGQIILKTMPQGKHSRLQKRLIYKIESIVLVTDAAEAFPELRCTFGGQSIVPDVVILQKHHIPHDPNGEIANSIEIAPDWMIEILSPDQDYKKVAQKILHSLEQGSQMGWLIDPEDKTVVVSPQNARSRLFGPLDAVLPVPNWAGDLQITVGELFGWLLG